MLLILLTCELGAVKICSDALLTANIYFQLKGKQVYVQYYGDSDPSGERMTAEDSKLVRNLTKRGISFERIAITQDTIEQFEGLEDIKDKETLEKLKRNPNPQWFADRHDV